MNKSKHFVSLMLIASCAGFAPVFGMQKRTAEEAFGNNHQQAVGVDQQQRTFFVAGMRRFLPMNFLSMFNFSAAALNALRALFSRNADFETIIASLDDATRNELKKIVAVSFDDEQFRIEL